MPRVNWRLSEESMNHPQIYELFNTEEQAPLHSSQCPEFASTFQA